MIINNLKNATPADCDFPNPLPRSEVTFDKLELRAQKDASEVLAN